MYKKQMALQRVLCIAFIIASVLAYPTTREEVSSRLKLTPLASFNGAQELWAAIL